MLQIDLMKEYQDLICARYESTYAATTSDKSIQNTEANISTTYDNTDLLLLQFQQSIHQFLQSVESSRSHFSTQQFTQSTSLLPSHTHTYTHDQILVDPPQLIQPTSTSASTKTNKVSESVFKSKLGQAERYSNTSASANNSIDTIFLKLNSLGKTLLPSAPSVVGVSNVTISSSSSASGSGSASDQMNDANIDVSDVLEKYSDRLVELVIEKLKISKL